MSCDSLPGFNAVNFTCRYAIINENIPELTSRCKGGGSGGGWLGILEGKMDEKKAPKKAYRWIGHILLIIIFMLLPGIRGYKNLEIHEYILFVFLPIVYFIYDLVKENKKDRLSSTD
jgi:hypothetical protein